jgi:hypothetical protein
MGGVVALAGLVLLGCSEESDGETAGLINTWQQAGLSPTVFLPLEVESLRPGTCKQGKVDDIETVVCRYADEAAARAAQNAGLAHVGENTGFALTAGSNLLIVADRNGADPAGRKINQVAAAFRKHYEASKAGEGAQPTVPKQGDQTPDKKTKADKKAAGTPKSGS